MQPHIFNTESTIYCLSIFYTILYYNRITIMTKIFSEKFQKLILLVILLFPDRSENRLLFKI